MKTKTFDQTKGIARGQEYKTVAKNWVANFTGAIQF